MHILIKVIWTLLHLYVYFPADWGLELIHHSGISAPSLSLRARISAPSRRLRARIHTPSRRLRARIPTPSRIARFGNSRTDNSFNVCPPPNDDHYEPAHPEGQAGQHRHLWLVQDRHHQLCSCSVLLKLDNIISTLLIKALLRSVMISVELKLVRCSTLNWS